MPDAPLLILLHGVKASGDDMRWLAGALSQHLPGALFAQPDAPFPYDQGEPGRQWFSTKAITAETRPARITEARLAFDGVIQAILTDYRRDDLSRVALVGFSQGAIMALDAVASGRWGVAGTVGFSGRLASPPPVVRSAPVLLVHGTADVVVPPQEMAQAARLLRDIGTPVRTRLFPGLGHLISADGAGVAGRFLARLFEA